MVSIFPPSSASDKPTLIFTHKELRSVSLRRKTILEPSSIIARRAFREISKKFVFGSHIGWPCAITDSVFEHQSSFILCNPEQARLVPQGSPTILSPAAWLSPDSAEKWRDEKIWDFATVATTGKHKNWLEALATVRNLLEEDSRLRILLVATPESYGAELKFNEDLKTLLGNVDSSRVDVVSAAPQGSKGVLPNSLLRRLLGLTKVFALFSTKEGTSKVLIEASKEGCITLANRQINHVSGERLPQEFAEFDPIQFESDCATPKVLEELDRYSASLGEKIREANHERFSYEKRRRFLQTEIERISGQTVNLDRFMNLSLALPAHTSEAPVFSLAKSLKNRRTSDVLQANDWRALSRWLSRW